VPRVGVSIKSRDADDPFLFLFWLDKGGFRQLCEKSYVLIEVGADACEVLLVSRPSLCPLYFFFLRTSYPPLLK
jgi:hypothetical protein